MPTKLNKAGNQQNYVPAGHGDASGEYGDNATGSNVHIQFTSFKKPEAEKPKKETRTKELSKKQIKEIGDYVKGRNLDDETRNIYLLKSLRYYNGSFGDLSGFSDEELLDIARELNDLPTSDEVVWYKKGSKWYGTRDTGLLEKAGIEYFTKEEKDKKIKEANIKLVEKSQNEQDKEIQDVLGDNSVVCFGKGYSKEDLKQVVEDTKTYIKDFPELKNYIKMMGDRNNLEKYYNALQDMTEPTEEEIQEKIAQIKKFTTYYNLSGEELEKKYRDDAIRRLKQPLKLSKISNAYAYWSNSERAMIYMAKMKNTTDDNTQRNYDINWHSSNKVNGIYCHEMGHAVDYAIDNAFEKVYNKYKTNYSPENVQSNIENYEKGKQIALEYQNFRNKIKDLYNQNFNKEYQNKFNDTFKEKTGLDYGSTSYNREKYEAEQYARNKLKEEGIKKYNISECGNTNIKEFVAESFSAYYTGMNNPLANQVVEAYLNISKRLKEFEK